MADTGLWLYGVVDADAGAPPTLIGVDGEHRVERIGGGRLAALASAVPLGEFGAEALQRGLEDIAFLERLARAHERVLDAALARGPVVPFRLCTIFEDEERVRAMLRAEGTELARALERLDGMEEWGVKGYLTSERAAAARTGAPASGTDYLLRKRQARDAAESAHEAADALVAGIHQDLARRAGAAVLSRPQDRRLSGHDGDMVLNASYLVPAAEVDAFTALVEELGELHRGSGVQLECTGPWPPYHFVDRA